MKNLKVTVKEILDGVMYIDDPKVQPYIKDLEEIIYEKSNLEVPKDVCSTMAKNMFRHVKQSYPKEKDMTLEELADDVIWAFEQ